MIGVAVLGGHALVVALDHRVGPEVVLIVRQIGVGVAAKPKSDASHFPTTQRHWSG